MKLNEVTEKSKKWAGSIIERDGGFLVPVYAVVKTDAEGRVMKVSYDRLNNVGTIDTN